MEIHTNKHCHLCKLPGAEFTFYKHKDNSKYLYTVCDRCRRTRYTKYSNRSPRFSRSKKDKPEMCRACKRTDVVFGTRLNNSGQRYYNLDCNTCKGRSKSTFMKRLRLSDPERYYKKRRHDQLMKCYKISLSQYEDMLSSQNGLCAICGRAEDMQAMPVDHDHKTGINRAILCHWCNKGLGQFFDNPALLKQAAEYLEKWSA